MNVGERLKSLRKYRGISQQELSDRLKINRSTYARYETGDTQADYETLEKLAYFFGVTIDFLIRGIFKFDIDHLSDWLWNFIIPRDTAIYFEDNRLGFTTRELTFNQLHKEFCEKAPDFATIHTYIYNEQCKKISLKVVFQLYIQNLGPDYPGQKDIFTAEISSVLSKVQQVSFPEEVLEKSKQFIKNQIAKMHMEKEDFVNEDHAGYNSSLVRIPILGTIKAGYNLYADQQVIGYSIVSKDEIDDGEYFFLQVKGDSMIEEGIKEGFRVLVRRQDYVDNGKIGVVLLNGEEATLKRVFYQDDTIILQASNRNVPPKIVQAEEAKIQGQVVKVEFDV